MNAEFGYRSATEIGRFIALAEKNASFTEDQAVDAAIVQKLLPKLHGSRKKLVPVLKALWEQCMTGVELENAESIPVTTSYPLTAEKILRMYHGAVDNGFTSFSEAQYVVQDNQLDIRIREDIRLLIDTEYTPPPLTL